MSSRENSKLDPVPRPADERGIKTPSYSIHLPRINFAKQYWFITDTYPFLNPPFFPALPLYVPLTIFRPEFERLCLYELVVRFLCNKIMQKEARFQRDMQRKEGRNVEAITSHQLLGNRHSSFPFPPFQSLGLL
jgi:hypothetical protein